MDFFVEKKNRLVFHHHELLEALNNYIDLRTRVYVLLFKALNVHFTAKLMFAFQTMLRAILTSK